jgi:hypothetical protein
MAPVFVRGQELVYAHRTLGVEFLERDLFSSNVALKVKLGGTVARNNLVAPFLGVLTLFLG